MTWPKYKLLLVVTLKIYMGEPIRNPNSWWLGE
jgi:hypothetical protein